MGILYGFDDAILQYLALSKSPSLETPIGQVISSHYSVQEVIKGGAIRGGIHMSHCTSIY